VRAPFSVLVIILNGSPQVCSVTVVTMMIKKGNFCGMNWLES
jgi:hypothetical protein